MTTTAGGRPNPQSLYVPCAFVVVVVIGNLEVLRRFQREGCFFSRTIALRLLYILYVVLGFKITMRPACDLLSKTLSPSSRRRSESHDAISLGATADDINSHCSHASWKPQNFKFMFLLQEYAAPRTLNKVRGLRKRRISEGSRPGRQPFDFNGVITPESHE